MRLALIGLAAATVIGTALPAAAQGVGIEVGTPGVGVRIGDPDRHYYREHRYRDRDRYYDNRGDCRTVTVRRERDDGTVVVRKQRRCD